MEDFKSIKNPEFKGTEETAEDRDIKPHLKGVENFESDASKANEEKYRIEKISDLEKYNLNLSDQLSKYAILLADERNEKKDILGKYDDLQKEYHGKVESLYREKSKIEKKYSFVFGMTVFLILMVAGIFILFFLGNIGIR